MQDTRQLWVNGRRAQVLKHAAATRIALALFFLHRHTFRPLSLQAASPEQKSRLKVGRIVTNANALAATQYIAGIQFYFIKHARGYAFARVCCLHLRRQ